MNICFVSRICLLVLAGLALSRTAALREDQIKTQQEEKLLQQERWALSSLQRNCYDTERNYASVKAQVDRYNEQSRIAAERKEQERQRRLREIEEVEETDPERADELREELEKFMAPKRIFTRGITPEQHAYMRFRTYTKYRAICPTELVASRKRLHDLERKIAADRARRRSRPL